MTGYQRMAWLQLAICLIAVVAVVVLGFTIGWSGALGGFGLLGLSGLLPLLFLPSRSKKVIADERDEAIQLAALRVAFGLSWIGIFLAAGVLMASGDNIFPSRAIPISTLPFFLLGLWLAFAVSHALTVILAYRSGK